MTTTSYGQKWQNENKPFGQNNPETPSQPCNETKWKHIVQWWLTQFKQVISLTEMAQ